MQQISTDLYDRNLFTEYDGYDASGRMNPVAQYSTIGRRPYGTYANVPYPVFWRGNFVLKANFTGTTQQLVASPFKG